MIMLVPPKPKNISMAVDYADFMGKLLNSVEEDTQNEFHLTEFSTSASGRIDEKKVKYRVSWSSADQDCLLLNIDRFYAVPEICKYDEHVRLHFDFEGKIGFSVDARCIGFSRTTGLPVFRICKDDTEKYGTHLLSVSRKPDLICVEKVNLGKVYICKASEDSYGNFNNFRVMRISSRKIEIEDGRLTDLYVFTGMGISLTFSKKGGTTVVFGNVESFDSSSGRIEVKFDAPLPAVNIDSLMEVQVFDVVPNQQKWNVGNVPEILSNPILSNPVNVKILSNPVNKKKKTKMNEVKHAVKSESKLKFTVGKEYKLRRKSLYSMVEKRYICKGVVWKIKNEPVGIVVMKCTEHQPDEYIFTLGKHDCRRLHIKFEPGLQVFSIKEKFIEVKKY